jgi:hypothetical protein
MSVDFFSIKMNMPKSNYKIKIPHYRQKFLKKSTPQTSPTCAKGGLAFPPPYPHTLTPPPTRSTTNTSILPTPIQQSAPLIHPTTSIEASELYCFVTRNIHSDTPPTVASEFQGLKAGEFKAYVKGRVRPEYSPPTTQPHS